MTGPSDRSPPARRKPRRDDSTIKDAALTNALNSRVKREVALERATETVEPDEGPEDARAVVVLGPDGVPQIADEVESAPATLRIDIDDAITVVPSPPPKKGPPPLPLRKR